ncbi:MAG TPA: SRPBCC domain-containing protein [Luteitalea sp.]|nr:SRPBCC domain-containing protein [Luteitalea sp.]
MNKTLQFSITIRAPREIVWERVTEKRYFDEWTSAFMPGSTFEGSWNTGDAIRFLAPDGSGMSSIIETSRRPEFVSIRHVGEIKDGVEDRDSEQVRRWAPAYENYTLTEVDGATEFVVDVDVTPEYEQFMRDAWPAALAKLKELSERSGAA